MPWTRPRRAQTGPYCSEQLHSKYKQKPQGKASVHRWQPPCRPWPALSGISIKGAKSYLHREVACLERSGEAHGCTALVSPSLGSRCRSNAPVLQIQGQGTPERQKACTAAKVVGRGIGWDNKGLSSSGSAACSACCAHSLPWQRVSTPAGHWWQGQSQDSQRASTRRPYCPLFAFAI